MCLVYDEGLWNNPSDMRYSMDNNDDDTNDKHRCMKKFTKVICYFNRRIKPLHIDFYKCT